MQKPSLAQRDMQHMLLCQNLQTYLKNFVRKAAITSQTFYFSYTLYLNWRSWSSPQGLFPPLENCSNEPPIDAFISSIPTTLGYSNFKISQRKELNSGSGIGGISSVVVTWLYSRSTTTTYKKKEEGKTVNQLFRVKCLKKDTQLNFIRKNKHGQRTQSTIRKKIQEQSWYLNSKFPLTYLHHPLQDYMYQRLNEDPSYMA